MSTVTEPSRTDAATPKGTPPAEQLVDAQIRRTVRALKLVDVTVGMLTLASCVLMFLLVAALLEHWIVPGGWNWAMRSLLFSVLLLGVVWQSWRVIWPLVSRSINPAYAAQTIEQGSPSLKNSLLNLLLLRNRKRHLSRQVYQAIEQQAAQRLSEVSTDVSLDRSAILRWGYFLLAIVALCALYRILSPKNLFTSAERVLAPWSEVAAPSRVQLSNITPGNTSVARGEQLEITAEVLRLEPDEQVRVLYSTTDQQIVDRELVLAASSGGIEFRGNLPGRRAMGSGNGVQQDLVYWLEAGDARSPKYRVTVFARPTLVVQEIRYEYPAYTGYPSRQESHTGDIRAIEGTRVTLVAEANKAISSAHVDFEADGKKDLLMKSGDTTATVTFPLQLRGDRRTPLHSSYVLRYVTEEGHGNHLPPKYQIDVTPDYAPEVQLLVPEEETINVRIDQPVVFEVEARDPDFALSRAVIQGTRAGKPILKKSLLEQQHTGRFVG